MMNATARCKSDTKPRNQKATGALEIDRPVSAGRQSSFHPVMLANMKMESQCPRGGGWWRMYGSAPKRKSLARICSKEATVSIVWMEDLHRAQTGSIPSRS